MSFLATVAESVTPASPGVMETMLGVMESVVEFSMTCFNTITTNPILAFIFAGSLVGVGIGVFQQFKGAAR